MKIFTTFCFWMLLASFAQVPNSSNDEDEGKSNIHLFDYFDEDSRISYDAELKIPYSSIAKAWSQTGKKKMVQATTAIKNGQAKLVDCQVFKNPVRWYLTAVKLKSQKINEKRMYYWVLSYRDFEDLEKITDAKTVMIAVLADGKTIVPSWTKNKIPNGLPSNFGTSTEPMLP